MVAELASPSLASWLNIGRVLVHDGLASRAIYRVTRGDFELFRQAAHGQLKHVCVDPLLILIIRLRHLWERIMLLLQVLLWLRHSIELRRKLLWLEHPWELRDLLWNERIHLRRLQHTLRRLPIHHLLWLLWELLLLLLGLEVGEHLVLRLRRHHLLIVT